MARTSFLPALILLLAALVLAACGNRGALEPPPGATTPPQNERVGDPNHPTDGGESFILDGLL